VIFSKICVSKQISYKTEGFRSGKPPLHPLVAHAFAAPPSTFLRHEYSKSQHYSYKL
jgi:hypothetical protein